MFVQSMENYPFQRDVVTATNEQTPMACPVATVKFHLLTIVCLSKLFFIIYFHRVHLIFVTNNKKKRQSNYLKVRKIICFHI